MKWIENTFYKLDFWKIPHLFLKSSNLNAFVQIWTEQTLNKDSLAKDRHVALQTIRFKGLINRTVIFRFQFIETLQGLVCANAPR